MIADQSKKTSLIYNNLCEEIILRGPRKLLFHHQHLDEKHIGGVCGNQWASISLISGADSDFNMRNGAIQSQKHSDSSVMTWQIQKAGRHRPAPSISAHNKTLQLLCPALIPSLKCVSEQ